MGARNKTEYLCLVSLIKENLLKKLIVFWAQFKILPKEEQKLRSACTIWKKKIDQYLPLLSHTLHCQFMYRKGC